MQALSGTSQAGLNCSNYQRVAACPTDLAANAELPAAPGAADTGSQTCAEQPCPGSQHCFVEAPEGVSPEPQVPSHVAAQIQDLQAQLSQLTRHQDRQVAVLDPYGQKCLIYVVDAVRVPSVSPWRDAA